MTKKAPPPSIEKEIPEEAPTEPTGPLEPWKAAGWGAVPSTDRRLHQRADEEAEMSRMTPEHLDPVPSFS